MASIGLVVGLIKALGGANPAVIEQAVSDWLDNHPEATTTVEDGAITEAKLAASLSAVISGKQNAPAAVGTSGQVLGLNDNLQPAWLNQSGGGVEVIRL